MNDDNGFHCSRCGEFHPDTPLAYGSPAPALYFRIPEDERDRRVELTADVCVIDDQFFFVLGNLESPITDTGGVFCWGVWVSLSRENFARTIKLWDSESRVDEPPYFGWLCTSLQPYPSTLSLKTHVHTRAVGRRPFVEVEPTEHPLAVEQRSGLTMERVREIAEIVLHPDS